MYLVGRQFVQPVRCLHKLADPEEVDPDGREIYLFRAFVSSRQRDEFFRNILSLKQGDWIYPDSLTRQRIQVSNGQGKKLGTLSFDDDELYFCLIPLLKEHRAHVKMIVKAVEHKQRPLLARAEIQFYFRLEQLDESYEIPGGSREIEQILKKYAELLASSAHQ